MVKERYIWVAFLIVVIAIAIYFRFYYQTSISLSISIPSLNSKTIYPYQSLRVPILVSNIGSSQISNLSFGLYVNGNISTVYGISIPPGKQATVQFNYTPASSGTYNITFKADPSGLYNIMNRQSAKASTIVTVASQEKAEPNMNLAGGDTGEDLFNLNPEGFEAALLYDNFTRYLYLTESQSVNNFFYPAIDVYSRYITQMAVAHAYYQNYSLVSIWISGYLTPNSLDEVAVGKGLNLTYDNNVSVINFGSNTTTCIWYSGGWTKTLSSISGRSCTDFLNDTGTMNSISLYYALKNRNESILNYSGFNGNLVYAGDIALKNNSVIYESLLQGSNFSNICYYNIFNISNVSYCSSTLLEGNIIVDQLTRLVGSNEITVSALSDSYNSIAYNYSLKLAGSYNLPGRKSIFVSAYANTCTLSQNLTCYNPRFTTNLNSSSITVTLMNDYNGPVKLNWFSCSSGGSPVATNLVNIMIPGQSLNVSTKCYQNGNVISGNPLGTLMYLQLNYTQGNLTKTAAGLSEVV